MGTEGMELVLYWVLITVRLLPSRYLLVTRVGLVALSAFAIKAQVKQLEIFLASHGFLGITLQRFVYTSKKDPLAQVQLSSTPFFFVPPSSEHLTHFN